MRRVVTGQRNGKSVILEDAQIPEQEMPFEGKMAVLWMTKTTLIIPLEEKDFKKDFPPFMPKPEEMRLILAVLPPDEVVFKKAKDKGIDPVEIWRQYFKDDYGMHTTDTIDYDIILSGELWMEVDDEVEVHLKPFDCVVQNGTRHAWRNKSSENCIMLSVNVGAKRNKTK
jgi:mannose-6-phosphate isomerase-like protein (cupin superfamily)